MYINSGMGSPGTPPQYYYKLYLIIVITRVRYIYSLHIIYIFIKKYSVHEMHILTVSDDTRGP